MIITIDGPCASGKSTVAQMLAQALDLYYLNTGSLYRAVSYLLVTQCGYTESTLSNVTQDAVRLCVNSKMLNYTYNSVSGWSIFYNQKNITSYLKDCAVDRSVAIISPIPFVRKLVTEVQHLIAAEHDAVIEGRDSGSVVFPHADYKFFLTASLKVRAQRWQYDQQKRGNIFTLHQAMQEIENRDAKDSSRNFSPLLIAQGAFVIDNSELSLQETVDMMITIIKGQ